MAPPSTCEPCECSPNQMAAFAGGEITWRTSVLTILCSILADVAELIATPERVTLRANYTTAQTDTVVVTAGASERIVVYRLSALADYANQVEAAVRIGFGAANTPTTTGVVLSHPGIAPGSGVIEGCAAGVLGYGAAGEDLRITSEVPTGGSIDVVVTYKIEAV